MNDPNENPRMPLTTKGVIYLLVLVVAAIATAYVVITGFGILDDDFQYAVTVGLIVLYVGIFFCRDSIWIGLWNRAIGSLIMAMLAFLLLIAIGFFFDYFFSV